MSFHPSAHQAKIWFNKLNEMLFDGELEKPYVEIRRRQGIWGEGGHYGIDEDGNMKTFISLTNKFRDKNHFLSVLAHEMVHLYQFMVGDSGNHNELFYSFREKFEENNLLLKRCY